MTGGSAGAIGQSSAAQTSTAGGASSQPDTQTQMAIQNDLHNNSTLVQNNVVNNINVTATTNNIVISGSVPDQQTAEQVLAIAKARAGARQVVNNLTVSAAAASGAVSGQTGSTAGTTGSTTGQAGASTSGQTGTTGAIGAQAGTAQGQTGGITTEHNDLVGQIQTALRNEPTLANDNVMVNITDDTVDLSGTVATGKEKQTAKRIAESFAANRRVVDHITVTGRGRNENPGKGNQGNVPPPQQ
jgi:osmotically-inducible protein OsmY